MKLEIEIAGRLRRMEINRSGARVEATIDGRKIGADVVDAGDDSYSILIGGRSFVVRVENRGDGVAAWLGGREIPAEVRDPRKFRRSAGSLSAEGRMQVAAPMPGKIIRVLIQEGERVEAGQGLLVVEAMKMQNEIRSPKSGIVEKLQVKEGQPVNSGDALAVIA